MTDQEFAQSVFAFLQRVDLKGAEVATYNAIVAKLMEMGEEAAEAA